MSRKNYYNVEVRCHIFFNVNQFVIVIPGPFTYLKYFIRIYIFTIYYRLL